LTKTRSRCRSNAGEEGTPMLRVLTDDDARAELPVGLDGIVVLDAVKLLQSNLADLCSAIWVVQCTCDEELRRLTEDRAMSSEDADNRLAAQPSFDDPRVTAVIDNSGTQEQTLAQVRRLWDELNR